MWSMRSHVQQVILQPDLAPENTSRYASKSLGRPDAGMCEVSAQIKTRWSFIISKDEIDRSQVKTVLILLISMWVLERKSSIGDARQELGQSEGSARFTPIKKIFTPIKSFAMLFSIAQSHAFFIHLLFTLSTFFNFSEKKERFVNQRRSPPSHLILGASLCQRTIPVYS